MPSILKSYEENYWGKENRTTQKQLEKLKEDKRDLQRESRKLNRELSIIQAMNAKYCPDTKNDSPKAETNNDIFKQMFDLLDDIVTSHK